MQLELVFSWSLAGFIDKVEYNAEVKSGKGKKEKRGEKKKGGKRGKREYGGKRGRCLRKS